MSDKEMQKIKDFRDFLKGQNPINPSNHGVGIETYLESTKVLLDRIEELEDLLAEERHG